MCQRQIFHCTASDLNRAGRPFIRSLFCHSTSRHSCAPGGLRLAPLPPAFSPLSRALQAIRRRRSRNWSARCRILHRPQDAVDSHVSKAPFVRPLFRRASVFVSAYVARPLTRPWINESLFPFSLSAFFELGIQHLIINSCVCAP